MQLDERVVEFGRTVDLLSSGTVLRGIDLQKKSIATICLTMLFERERDT